MTDSDKQQFAAIMLGVAENYGATITKEGLALRFAALVQYDIEDVRRAAMSLMATRKFSGMPNIAEFLEHVTGGNADDKAQVEAGKVWDAIKTVGSYDNVAFDDPVTQAVIMQTFGGWSKLCGDMTVDQQKWFVKDFAKAYAAYARQGIRHYGALEGRHGTRTALIGDRKKAQAIIEMKRDQPPSLISFDNQNRLSVSGDTECAPERARIDSGGQTVANLCLGMADTMSVSEN